MKMENAIALIMVFILSGVVSERANASSVLIIGESGADQIERGGAFAKLFVYDSVSFTGAGIVESVNQLKAYRLIDHCLEYGINPETYVYECVSYPTESWEGLLAKPYYDAIFIEIDNVSSQSMTANQIEIAEAIAYLKESQNVPDRLEYELYPLFGCGDCIEAYGFDYGRIDFVSAGANDYNAIAGANGWELFSGSYQGGELIEAKAAYTIALKLMYAMTGNLPYREKAEGERESRVGDSSGYGLSDSEIEIIEEVIFNSSSNLDVISESVTLQVRPGGANWALLLFLTAFGVVLIWRREK